MCTSIRRNIHKFSLNVIKKEIRSKVNPYPKRVKNLPKEQEDLGIYNIPNI